MVRVLEIATGCANPEVFIPFSVKNKFNHSQLARNSGLKSTLSVDNGKTIEKSYTVGL